MIINRQMLEEYLKDDFILKLINVDEEHVDKEFVIHQWLLNSEPKRMLFDMMYGDLLSQAKNQKVLDVGGGYTALTRQLMTRHLFDLLDLNAHDDDEKLTQIVRGYPSGRWINQDWFEFQPEHSYDCIIANDLFPNVDQRLEMFLEKYLPIANEIRLSLTYYNNDRYYHVKRIDADEHLCLLAWGGWQIKHVLDKYNIYIQNRFDSEDLLIDQESLYPNQRQVCVLSLRK